MKTFKEFITEAKTKKEDHFSLKNLTKTKIGNKTHYSYEHPSDKTFRWEGTGWDRKHAMSKVRDAYDRHRGIVNEEVPANATGSAVAGTTGEPPVGRKKKKPIVMRRFASQDVFEVDSDTYSKCLNGKKKYDRYENYVGKDDVGQAIRSYGRDRKNTKKSILVQNASTGVMTYLKRGK